MDADGATGAAGGDAFTDFCFDRPDAQLYTPRFLRVNQIIFGAAFLNLDLTEALPAAIDSEWAKCETSTACWRCSPHEK
jgi:hypothetical protein